VSGANSNTIAAEWFVGVRSAHSNLRGLADALIAATTLIYELKLFTFNSNDFKFIPELTLSLVDVRRPRRFP